MTTEQIIAVESHPSNSYAVLADYWALTKPDINFLIAITTFAGLYLGYAGPPRGPGMGNSDRFPEDLMPARSR